MGKDGFLPDLAKATDDIKVQIVFCNAGYLLTGFFHNRWAPSAYDSHFVCLRMPCSRLLGEADTAACTTRRGRGTERAQKTERRVVPR